MQETSIQLVEIYHRDSLYQYRFASSGDSKRLSPKKGKERRGKLQSAISFLSQVAGQMNPFRAPPLGCSGCYRWPVAPQGLIWQSCHVRLRSHETLQLGNKKVSTSSIQSHTRWDCHAKMPKIRCIPFP